jgi:hypothetical protein
MLMQRRARLFSSAAGRVEAMWRAVPAVAHPGDVRQAADAHLHHLGGEAAEGEVPARTAGHTPARKLSAATYAT